MAKTIVDEFYLTYDEVTPNFLRSVISRMEEKLEWKSKQNYQEIYDYFYNELGITTTTTSETTNTETSSIPSTTEASEPDNASMLSWSLTSLLFSLSFVIFAL